MLDAVFFNQEFHFLNCQTANYRTMTSVKKPETEKTVTGLKTMKNYKTPLVLGMSLLPGISETASNNALPTALNMPSAI